LTANPKDTPNVMLIVMDCARPDHLSCYGYHRDTSPNLDRIAQEGVVYENATTSAVWTLPSHATFFTGVFPSKHGCHGKHYHLDTPYVTLAELLSSRGYDTVCATANSWISEATGLTRGFETLIATWWRHVPRWRALWRWVPPFLKGIARHFFYAYRYDDGARQLNAEIKEWVTRHCAEDKGRPFFMFVNYIEPHMRYRAPEPYRFMYLPEGITSKEALNVNQDLVSYVTGETPMSARDFEVLEALYDGEIRYLDFRLQEIFDLLGQQGILDNTLLIIISDHGENIGDHELLGHLFCVYDSLMRVPMIIRYPRAFPAGERISSQVQLLDIYPTIMESLGIEDMDIQKELQGESLAFPGIRHRQTPYVIAEYMGPVDVFNQSQTAARERYGRELRAIRTDSAKYVWAGDGDHELYDLVEDPGESRNLMGRYPAQAAEMQRTLDEWLTSFDHKESEGEVELDDETKERLRGLGYLP